MTQTANGAATSENSVTTNVLQDWVSGISFMQQTVLLTAVRGPDGIPKYHITKYLLRWMRRCFLRSSLENGCTIETPWGDGGGSFMGPSYKPPYDRGKILNHSWQSKMDGIVGEYLRSLDELPHHFQLHFLHAAQIIGHKHPDTDIRLWWNTVYVRLVHDMHLWPETVEQMDTRLGDNREQWLARNDLATVD